MHILHYFNWSKFDHGHKCTRPSPLLQNILKCKNISNRGVFWRKLIGFRSGNYFVSFLFYPIYVIFCFCLRVISGHRSIGRGLWACNYSHICLTSSKYLLEVRVQLLSSNILTGFEVVIQVLLMWISDEHGYSMVFEFKLKSSSS